MHHKNSSSVSPKAKRRYILWCYGVRHFTYLSMHRLGRQFLRWLQQHDPYQVPILLVFQKFVKDFRTVPESKKCCTKTRWLQHQARQESQSTPQFVLSCASNRRYELLSRVLRHQTPKNRYFRPFSDNLKNFDFIELIIESIDLIIERFKTAKLTFLSDIRPGISFSAMVISFRPHSQRLISATL